MSLLVPQCVLATLLPLAAQAHAVASDASPATAWNLEPWLLALMGASALLYGRGAARLWKKAGSGRGITHAQALRFALGWMALGAALVSPADALGERSFAVHMVQHEILMIVAAPLLVTGRPLEAWTWALPMSGRRALGNAVRASWIRTAWSAITEPVGAWCVHAVALWAWHVPGLFEAALGNEAIHIAQHSCFLFSALLFWWSVLSRPTRQAEGLAVASIFTTMLHTGVLGALLTFAPRIWYPHYAGTSAFGLSPLEDQQLGGLIMWVPTGLVYIAAGLGLVATWLLRDGPREPRFR